MMKNHPPEQETIQGILLVNKEKGSTSFNLIRILRKRLAIKKIGHAGTLDPLATGVMVLLIGRNYTRLSDQFLCKDKEYEAEICLGKSTDTFDAEGKLTFTSAHIPQLDEVHNALTLFQGEIEQIPPMFSAKKVQGKKLYELARKGQEVERHPVKVHVQTQFVQYKYPFLCLRIACSKGTYIRSISHDLGKILGCGAHLTNLRRTRSGQFTLEDCINEAELVSPDFNLIARIRLHENS